MLADPSIVARHLAHSLQVFTGGGRFRQDSSGSRLPTTTSMSWPGRRRLVAAEGQIGQNAFHDRANNRKHHDASEDTNRMNQIAAAQDPKDGSLEDKKDAVADEAEGEQREGHEPDGGEPCEVEAREDDSPVTRADPRGPEPPAHPAGQQKEETDDEARKLVLLLGADSVCWSGSGSGS